MKRCPWVGKDKPHMEAYHDKEWGVPVKDDKKHFEMLILEGAQAGLSWDTILKRRKGYAKAFKNFDVKSVAKMTDKQLDALMHDEGIIRNRLKIYSARNNAKIFMDIQKEFGSFNSYIWRFVDNKVKVNKPKKIGDINPTTKESDALSKDLKKRGMKFVGSTIMYAYMQATGMVNDHFANCSFL